MLHKHIIQGINSWAKHKEAQRPKGPTWQLHMRETQPISKATRHQSEATPSRRNRCIHEDPRAHQSYQTDSRQVLTHIPDMGAHLAVFWPKTGANGASPRSAEQLGRPAQWWRPTGPTASQMTRGEVWSVPNGGLAHFSGKRLVAPSYKYKGRGWE